MKSKSRVRFRGDLHVALFIILSNRKSIMLNILSLVFRPSLSFYERSISSFTLFFVRETGDSPIPSGRAKCCYSVFYVNPRGDFLAKIHPLKIPFMPPRALHLLYINFTPLAFSELLIRECPPSPARTPDRKPAQKYNIQVKPESGF